MFTVTSYFILQLFLTFYFIIFCNFSLFYSLKSLNFNLLTFLTLIFYSVFFLTLISHSIQIFLHLSLIAASGLLLKNNFIYYSITMIFLCLKTALLFSYLLFVLFSSIFSYLSLSLSGFSNILFTFIFLNISLCLPTA